MDNSLITRKNIFFALLTFSLFMVISFILLDNYIYNNQTKKELLQYSKQNINEINNYSKEYFENKKITLNSIVKSNAFNDYLNGVSIYSDNIKDMFITIARNQNDIMQLRYIDENGKEKIRIDRNNLDNNPILLNNNKLQDKSDRYYFTSKKNTIDKIWFSNLDLNIENGEIEVPFKPTLRAIKPIFNNGFRGIIIINYFAQDYLERVSHSSSFDVKIFDEDGYIIKDDKSKYDWNRFTKKTYSFENTVGYTFKEITKGDSFEAENFIVSKLDMKVSDNNFYIMFRINDEYLETLEAQKKQIYLKYLLIIFIVIILFSFYMSRLFEKLIIAIKQSEQKAINSAKAKSEFLANMSHEIRTPLNGVTGLIQLVLDTDLNKLQKDYLLKAKFSSNALLTVINDILDYSKIEAGKLNIRKQEFVLQDILDNISSLFGFKIYEKRLNFSFKIDKEVPNNLVTDSLRITQILNNLVGNALKFTDKGYIHIYIDVIKKDVEQKEVELQFCVEDSGIGINEEACKKLFSAFIQADTSNTRNYGGTGLGLTISKKLSQLLGGKIWLESKEGVGSKFYFTVKCEYRDSFNIESIKNTLKDKKFLIVDDSEIERNYLENIVKSWNAYFKTTSNGFDAIEYLKNNKVDYMILDWNMPIMNGFEVIKELENLKIELPLVLMVSSFEKEILLKSAKESNLDIQKIISKPFTPSILFNEINNKQKNLILKNEVVELKFNLEVLLVEDNEINQIVASKFLEKFGLKVEYANNGLEALNLVKSKKYDIVFMDLQMPIMDGFEATKKMREIGIDYPIIALSAAVMQKDRELTLEAGMNMHIAKPIIFNELREVLLTYFEPIKEDKNIQDTKDSDLISEKDAGFYGIDVEEFISTTGIEYDILVDMLKIYYKTNKDIISDLKSLDIKTKEFNGAIHKLKGSSGNLHIKKIYELLVLIEKESDSKKINSLLNELYINLEKTLNSIQIMTKNK